MLARLGWAGIALFALLVAVPPTAAQESAPAAAADTASKGTAAKPRVKVGFAGVGGLIGGSKFIAADDYSKGALPRFDFSGSFRYVLSDAWRLQVSPGFTWAAYAKEEAPPSVNPLDPTDSSKEGYVTQLVPITAQLQYTWGQDRTRWHLGAGPGVYRVVVQSDRSVLLDNVTYAKHQGQYLGMSVELGYERFLKSLPTTSVEVSLVNHFVLATRDEQFPAGWNSSLNAVAARIGMNYYFDVGVVDREARKLPPSATGAKKK